MDGEFKALIAFQPMLDEDNRASAQSQTRSITDARAFQIWDESQAIGEVVTRTLGLTKPAWDVYLLYPPGRRWDDTDIPEPDFWMHQLNAEYGIGDAPRLEPAALSRQISGLLHDATNPHS